MGSDMKIHVKVAMGFLLLLPFGAETQTNEQIQQDKNALYHMTLIDLKYVTDKNVVQNYQHYHLRHYHLRKAADGYEWIRYMSDTFVLVNAKTGIIEKIVTRTNIPPESPGDK
jgi:Ni/Co efflux regulator RcnB